MRDMLPPSALRPVPGEWCICPTGYPVGGFHVARPDGVKLGAGGGNMPRRFRTIEAAERAIASLSHGSAA